MKLHSAQATAFVGEPAGVIDREDEEAYQFYIDTVKTNLMNAGEITNYNHNANGSYKLPFDKIPLCDFISGDARYQSSFRWDRRLFAQDTLGATSKTLNLSLNGHEFCKAYNKVPYLKEINNKRPKGFNRNE